MSSFFDEASLVFIPSGYKTSKAYSVKPTDGSGDLVFSRSNDTASRIGPDGLIEKVRTNLVLSSNNISTQSTFWGANQNGTTTQNSAAAPDGTTTAALITPDGVSSFSGVSQSKTFTAVPQTYSVYLKTNSGTADVNILAVDNASNFFGLTPITINTTWTRYTLTFTPAAGAGNIYITSAGSTAWLAWGAQLETSDIATNLIATTSAAVSVGPVANVPRLDYLNSSCPRLLLEPQRQNVITFSEQMDNAAWSKTNVTITANSTTSPDGYTNADTITSNSAAAANIYQVKSATSSTTYTASVFVKKDNNESRFPEFLLRTESTSFSEIYVQLNTKTGASTIRFQEGTASKSVESFGDYWRVSLTVTNIGDTQIIFRISPAITNVFGTFNPQVGSIIAYGAQLEAGAYATSYIATLGAAVTRGADAASKTGISSLIGQTEGTLFADITIPTMANTGANLVSISLFNAGLTNATLFDIYDTGDLFAVHVNGTAQASIQKTAFTAGRHKIAFGYKANDFVLYVDGVLVGTDTSGTVGAQDSFGLQYGTSQFIGQQYVNQALLFKTRLSNSSLAELTSL